MIRLTNATLHRGAKILFQDAALTLHPGQRVGLIGANGAGKSSLFALLMGDLSLESGELSMPPSWVIAHVAQETPAVDRSALEYVIDGDRELREIEAQLRASEHDGVLHAECLARFEQAGGYQAEARAGKLLFGLGFSADELARPVTDFSGGWRMRLNLAQALMCRSDLLLLDEPTNHLDLETVMWLEGWLNAYRGTMLLISHDRDFLDGTVDRIAHLANNKITLYTGNYADFENQRAEQLSQQQAAFESQQRKIQHLQSFVDRFKAQATKAKQAQSRVKAIERMEKIAAAHVDSPFEFSFAPPESSPNPVLAVESGAVGYPQRTILNKFSFSIQAGARIGLLGRNGAGKSTLIKLLAEELALSDGRKVEGKGIKIGYFAQHQLEQLRPEYSALWHLQKLDPTAKEQDLRNFLGGFNFGGEMATAAIAPFSGGEKSRLALALLIWQRPNLLLLDEPTNHLDLEMRDALSLALQDYEGALVLVSHDRYLLRATTDQFWLVDQGTVAPFDGDLDDYRRWRIEADAAEQATSDAKNGVSDRKAQKRQEAELRQKMSQLKKPLQKELDKVELQLAQLQPELKVIETELAGEAIYLAENKEKLKQMLLKQATLSERIGELEGHWLDLQEKMESLTAE
ncbi:ATP-binding cassette domain-containing protein [Chitinimonas sp. DQS-5]|uniref:ATP-binding cassette domain-containing protein n=1 Tax=Parachitinimonas caeni TaxID=3031301 RepID=A0ABT7DZN1_9NEIS|nr:ATP-binding cassette domain-containing protein [Parachitinimonas caeni]